VQRRSWQPCWRTPHELWRLSWCAHRKGQSSARDWQVWNWALERSESSRRFGPYALRLWTIGRQESTSQR